MTGAASIELSITLLLFLPLLFVCSALYIYVVIKMYVMYKYMYVMYVGMHNHIWIYLMLKTTWCNRVETLLECGLKRKTILKNKFFAYLTANI